MPLNTLLKEMPDKRKADLIAVCRADESNRAYVLRVQVKLGQSSSNWVHEAEVLADGASVLKHLKRAQNLAGANFVHVPVWMAPHTNDAHAAGIARAGVHVVRGQDFWNMQIPHVRAIAWLLPRSGAS